MGCSVRKSREGEAPAEPLRGTLLGRSLALPWELG